MARVSSEENLARLLALPAWVSRHDGATIEEAAAHFHVSVDQLSADVERLWMTGLPGQAPGDLVDFSATDYENGRLRLNEGLGLERPVRLSRDEAISLLLAARVLRRVVSTDPEADAVVFTLDAVAGFCTEFICKLAMFSALESASRLTVRRRRRHAS